MADGSESDMSDPLSTDEIDFFTPYDDDFDRFDDGMRWQEYIIGEKEMDGETYETCLDAVFSSVLDNRRYIFNENLEGQKKTIIREINLLHMFFGGLAYIEELEYDWHLRFAMKSMMQKLRQIAKDFVADCRGGGGEGYRVNLGMVMYDFVKTIDEQIRPQVKDVCLLLLGGANYKCKSCPPNQEKFVEYLRDTGSFTDLILHNLKEVFSFDLIAPVITLIQGRLENFGTHANHPSEVKNLCKLISLARGWLTRISCLAHLNWSDGKDKSMASTLEDMISSLLHETIPFSTTTRVISYHFRPTLVPQLLASYFEYIVDDLVIHMKGNKEILCGKLTLLLSFLLELPNGRSKISGNIFSALNKVPSLYYSIHYGEMDGVKFSDFLVEIDTLNEEVRKLSIIIPYSSHTISLKTDVLGFFDSMMENLKNILEGLVFIPLIKNVCELLWNDFVFLRPILKNITDQGVENGEIQDLWREIIEIVYNTDYFIKVSHVRGICTWYCMLGFDYIIECLGSVKVEIEKLNEFDKVHLKEKLDHHGQAKETYALQSRATTSEIERVSIGFMEDQQSIMDELTSRGKTSLTVISISGSGGQGKTTFAKRIYNHPDLQRHFQKFVWCYVSEKCPIKEVLIQAVGVDTNSLDVQDLKVQLWRSLREKRYLVVLDDIWDESAWHKLEPVFPNDNKGSRILFTTRNHDLASKFVPNSVSHPLPLFSDHESWKLIKNEVFGSGSCNEAFMEIGMEIARYCKGLPLAVVLITGVLRRIKQDFILWNKVADNLKTHLANEGCGKVIELSYNHLPDHLKSCFQYFGTFERGTNVRAKELKLLWIGEGFVIKDENHEYSGEDTATRYLNSLVSQGLVVVTDRSSTGGIKTCNVHDLLYDMCLEKCKDDHFLNWVSQEDFFGNYKKFRRSNHSRLCIGEIDHFIDPAPIVTKKELPISSLHSLLCHSYYFEVDPLPFLSSFKILTVLKVELEQVANEFPKVILSCSFLRYLQIHIASGSIRYIPPTIANLWKLEVFIISKGSFSHYEKATKLPNTMWSMKTLRHVHIKLAILDLKDSVGKHCSDIATLSSISFDKVDGTIADVLRKLPKLRKFGCSIAEALKGDVVKLISMVGSISTQLKSLKVHRHFVKGRKESDSNPNTFCGFSKAVNLSRLILAGYFHIPWHFMSEIGKQLPNLRVLKLDVYACEGPCWKLEDGDFPKLEYLKLTSLKIEVIDESSCEENPFPCLEHLVLERCWLLREIPHVFHEQVVTLETIKVTKCHKSVGASALNMLEVQREYGNDVLKVIIEDEIEEEGEESH